jgi:hypothetical protein
LAAEDTFVMVCVGFVAEMSCNCRNLTGDYCCPTDHGARQCLYEFSACWF